MSIVRSWILKRAFLGSRAEANVAQTEWQNLRTIHSFSQIILRRLKQFCLPIRCPTMTKRHVSSHQIQPPWLTPEKATGKFRRVLPYSSCRLHFQDQVTGRLICRSSSDDKTASLVMLGQDLIQQQCFLSSLHGSFSGWTHVLVLFAPGFLNV